MPMLKNICSTLIPVALLAASPTIMAQTHSPDAVETIKTESEHPAKAPLPASWHGKDVALRGRDVVSFHKDTGPLKGSKEFTADWDDTKWYFASEKNRDAFKTDPRKYIPEFGGYCPVALSKGKAKVGRTDQFTRVDEKLYLNYNKQLKRDFTSNPDEYILRAQINW